MSGYLGDLISVPKPMPGKMVIYCNSGHAKVRAMRNPRLIKTAILVLFFIAAMAAGYRAWAYPNFMRPLPLAEKRRSAVVPVMTDIVVRDGCVWVMPKGSTEEVPVFAGYAVRARAGMANFIPVTQPSAEVAEIVWRPFGPAVPGRPFAWMLTPSTIRQRTNSGI